MAKRPHGPATIAIHGSPARRPDREPVATPIFQSSTFTHPIGSSDEVLYTRYGTNPNQVKIGERLAALEEADAAIFVSSGMAATALAHLAVLRPGDHLLASTWLYGGTHRLFDEEFGKFGIDVSYVDPAAPRSWKLALKRTTRAIFVETPTNPLTRIIDLQPVAQLAQQEGLALVVDSTFATPINFRPIPAGADIVIHSATKYLNGHSDVIAGAVVGSEALVTEVRERMKLWGQALDPMAAWLIERGLKTLALRVERQNASALALARWLSDQGQVRRVHYPGLPAHPEHRLAKKLFAGFGGIVGVELKGGARAASRFIRRLKIASHAPSLGGVETLVSEPRLTSHANLTPTARQKTGIPDGFVRVSVGVEDIDDLIADFGEAFAGR